MEAIQPKKVALVTGCSSGVGMHTAVLLAKEGLKVFATLRDMKKAQALEKLAQEENVELGILPLDVQSEQSIQAAVEQICQTSGGIDVLVNNAGFGSVRALEQYSFDELQEVMDVNFYGAARCIRAALPHMREKRSGHIVSVTSVGGLVGQPLNEVYCAAKFALEGLVESMAIYLEPFFNIRMTLIEPAGIKTDFVSRIRGDLQKSPLPLPEVYGPVLQKYQDTVQKRGAFEQGAQSPAQVAEVIVQCITHPTRDLRVQTSDGARAFAAEKLQGDSTGILLQKKIRKLSLDLND